MQIDAITAAAAAVERTFTGGEAADLKADLLKIDRGECARMTAREVHLILDNVLSARDTMGRRNDWDGWRALDTMADRARV